MERHGRSLARSHVVRAKSKPDRLLARLGENQKLLDRACTLLTEAVQHKRRLTPAGEWLLDNIYLIEEQISIARRHLPSGYSRELPQLAAGSSIDLPRVYDIAVHAISHGDGRIDAENLSRYVVAYQSVTPLRIGELWAIPIMLRLALIENLRRIGAQLIQERLHHNLAEFWADRLTEVAESSPENVVLVTADMARSQPPAVSSFVTELAHRIQGRSAALVMPLTWVEQWLANAGHSIEQMVQAESRRQAAIQVSISNSIGSLRFLTTMDWREFVETMSHVDQSLRRDPDGVYGRMDFTTRDRYRQIVELIARRGGLAETDVADKALELAHAGAERGNDLDRHVGYYLVDAGRRRLEDALKLRGFNRRIRSTARRLPLLAYTGPTAALVAILTWAMLSHVHPTDGAAWLWLGVAGVLCVIAFSEMAVALVNWSATILVRPNVLPRLDLSKGIPAELRTMVVVPTLLGNPVDVRAQAEALEIRFLANREANLHFALLTDFHDADSETLPGDTQLLEIAAQAIDALNARHASTSCDRFFLFHRPRVWNPGEGAWMGYERKRGKLAALNAFLRDGRTEGFLRVVGNTRALGNVRYVITVDADTRLPRDSARELIATLAHPLNRARFDTRRRIVTRGYGILQPRVGAGMGAQQRSRYANLYGSEPGIDPYTRAVSDVYHDLFSEGSFVGKGIYDIDAFEQALAGRMPDNRILSHDLLEGCYARAGLVSDVQLHEDFPARYLLDVKRRHRWTRGDWQLLPWLLPWVPTDESGRERNPLSMLSRGKLLDNLRRSLVPIAMTALFLFGWLLSPYPLAWTLWLLAIMAAQPLVASIRDLFNRPPDVPLPTHLRQARSAIGRNFAPVPLSLARLPFEAWVSLDAIGRTLWRMGFSRRRLLQWSPFSEVERSHDDSIAATLRTMWPALLLPLATAVALLDRPGTTGWIAAPVLLLWAASPWLMWWLGRPRVRPAPKLGDAELGFLGRLARRTWGYFETHVTEADHWLPPDNVQEHPAPVVARRTSPTNIGLGLLADLAAYDFGYVSVGSLIERCGNTLRTMQSLPRFRGHFFNWYDTATLEPLPPRYVSSVDSGNLAGHLLTLRQGLLALTDAPLWSPSCVQGLTDTFGVLNEAIGSNADTSALAVFRTRLRTLSQQPPQSLDQAWTASTALVEGADILAQQYSSGQDEAADWAQALLRQCQQAREELLEFAPWLDKTADSVDLASGPLNKIPTPRELATLDENSEHLGVRAAVRAARARILELERLADVAWRCAQMDHRFLYDSTRHLLWIGYNVDEARHDPGYYDLLASEARLGNFVAIALGQLPQESWFALGRLLTEIDGRPTLLSWSGSMFEYLMPQLVMPTYEGTLLDQSARHSVRRQIDYGRQRDVPWGISESGYHLVDARMNYQYRAFGVPGLGLKRGLSQDLVVAPYASMLALMVEPEQACRNLQRLSSAGFAGRLGLYEAIDYTPARLPRGQTWALIRSYMAHHQGMGLLALDYILRGQPMQKRFKRDPEFQATLLLLQERIPRIGIFHPHSAEVAATAPISEMEHHSLRVFQNPSARRPAIQLLSNGRFHVMLTSAGGGYCRLGELALTRWREDGTCDPWGSFCYLRDVDSGDYWSAAYQPTAVPVSGYEAIFSDAKAEFRGQKNGFETHLEIAVSPEDDIELRRLRISNRTRSARTIELTTYAEVVLAPAIADEMHTAFSKLFVQTELLADHQAILCTRRPRSHGEPAPWMFHLLDLHHADAQAISYETDRSRFIGRGNTLTNPRALTESEMLSNTDGSVLDPILAIRCRITLAAGESATIGIVSGIAPSRETCIGLIEKYRDLRQGDRVFDLAWTHSQIVRRQINATQLDAQLYERLAGHIVFANPTLRARQTLVAQNRRGQSGLWGQSISGDLPIVLVRISDAVNFELVRQMVQAHAYWRLKGLVVDLVIWNEDRGGYRQELHDRIMGLIAAGVESHVIDRSGGIFVRPAQQLAQEDRTLLLSVARVIVSDRDGSLAQQTARTPPAASAIARFAPVPIQDRLITDLDLGGVERDDGLRDVGSDPRWPFSTVREPLILDNGCGAFSADGSEYVIDQTPGGGPPAPWSNVLANAGFGCVVSERTPGYTWAENAHEFRLSPWHNDPVIDGSGEAFYLRDEQTGLVWSPMPFPCRGSGRYRTRHGFGYSVFEHVEDGIFSELWIYVDQTEAIKFSVLRIHNRSGQRRRLSLTGYVEWVLGDLPAKTRMHVITEVDGDSKVLTARNVYNTEFEHRVAFFDCDAMVETADGHSYTGDRDEFLGRNGSPQRPAAMLHERLSGSIGACLDPCAAIQVPLELEDGQMVETTFRLGVGRDWGSAIALALRTRGAEVARAALKRVREHWRSVLDVVQVETPDPELDVLANGWLLYQTIACRYLARSGYYQSSGAIGFRDQLQDTMAMLHAEPELARAHLLLCANHQFPEGDVLHWWHPPLGRGVRTHCSDDYLWLPFVTAHYVEVTGDSGVLDESAGYVEGRLVNPDEESYYDLPARSGLRQSLYQHCLRALHRALDLLGQRGLPLMLAGDWNDGMNRVGEARQGESVWLGFFLYATLQRFAPIARERGDDAAAAQFLGAAGTLRGNLEANAWDGAWYRRAWFDDGTPLGSAQSDECRIDSIAQSWAVLSGAGDGERCRQALDSLYQHLVRRDAGLVQLLDPPFDRAMPDPGYIRGYVPGVRENGGQYTHAAIWAAMAFAHRGDRHRAWELLRMINPVNHGRSAEAIATYMVEPYVAAADVYAVAPHVGRGGWTWYTGSAGWMYRLIIESLLGLQRRGRHLHLRPCLPPEWQACTLRYRHGHSLYCIHVRQDGTKRRRLTVDGVERDDWVIALSDDGQEHRIDAWIGKDDETGADTAPAQVPDRRRRE